MSADQPSQSPTLHLGSIDRRANIERWAVVAAFAGAGALLVFLADGRSFLTFSTESDFLGGFLKEALRVLDGEPLRLPFHPPLYAITIAGLQSILNDWVTAGLSLSVVSGIAVLGTSFAFFYSLCGPFAAWGSLIGLSTSPLFLSFAASATSDVFFLALYSAALLLALLAARANRAQLWILCGVATGCALLTRSNAVTLLLLCLVPWLCSRTNNRRWANGLALVGGIAAPLLAWIVFAIITGSQLVPTGNHVNLALTYFAPGPDRISAEGLAILAEKFDSLWQVLTYDPAHMLKTYLRDLYHISRAVLQPDSLMAFPWHLFVVPGLVFLVLGANRAFLFYLFVLTISQILLINLKAYEPRYYLLLVPLFGAAAGECWRRFYILIRARWVQALLAASAAACGVVALDVSLSKSMRYLHKEDRELSSAVAAIQSHPLPVPFLVARKPHLCFYTGCTTIVFRNVETLTDLRSFLSSQQPTSPLYLYYGSAERRLRPQFASLQHPEQSPDWLKPVASEEGPNGWVLYRFESQATPKKDDGVPSAGSTAESESRGHSGAE